MKVLHINQSDIGGGAAIAAYRLHQGLLDRGLSSKLLVGQALTVDPLVNVIIQNARLNNQLSRFSSKLGLEYLNVLSTFGIPKHPFYQEADVINFHNLHASYGWFNYLALAQLTNNKPSVLTLHDMWSFTGHCAYSYDCDRWKIGCGKCPYPNTYPKVQYDNTRIEWKLKHWVYNNSNLTIVAPSNWLTAQAKSSLLNRYPIHCIPYGIDTEAYQPIDSYKCKEILGIPANHKVLMFGATNLKEDRKGGDLLFQILQNLPAPLKTELTLLTFGNRGEEIAKQVGIEVISLGYLNSDRLKSIAYSAADLFIFPTRADNLPLTLQESIACGTPIVSFEIGGVPDLVRPGITGYLAPPRDIQTFCDAIIKLLADQPLRAQMSANCRKIARSEYPLDLQAQRYLQLYEQLITNN
jgi:glycosyltransferase involved in cell wall biosynthesis